LTYSSRGTFLAFVCAAALIAGTAHAGLPLDFGVYRPSTGQLFIDFDHDGRPDRAFQFSPVPEKVLVADMNGDGIADIVTFRAGVWTIDYDRDGVPDVTYFFGGMPGDIPLLGDVDGDGNVDLVIYRNGTWLTSTHRDGVADRINVFGGLPGDIPVLGDVNCDGVAERIIYNAGVWYADLTGDGTPSFIGGIGGDPADRPFVADWDGDCWGDLGIFRNGEWYVLASPLASPNLRTLSFGGPGDMPIAGRLQRVLTGAKFHHLSSRYGIYRPSDRAFYFRMTPGPNPDLVLYPGVSATHALAGDLDGTGKSTLVLYSAGTWLVDRGMDGVADDVYTFGGAAGDVPLVGDVDGDGRADLVIYNGGAWYVSTARDGSVAMQHHFGGAPGDIPVLGDVDGDGKADFGIYRNGTWYFDTLRDGSAAVTYAFGGVPGDVPLVGDWDGDGKLDLVIYRGGEWFVTTDPASRAVSIYEIFGGPTDIPVTGNFVVEASATPVLFDARPRPIEAKGPGMLSPTIADFDGDGRYEPLGGRNEGNGSIAAIDLAAAGLSNLFSPGRVNRDCRAADFNGDGFVDLVCNTYSDINNAASFARLFFGNGAGGFVEAPSFAALDIRGYGETILAADFNNDGQVDLFIPYYSHNDPREHSYLLLNSGTGHFTDIADAAGVALRGVPLANRVEGAQAVDYDGDGWIDFYVAGRLFHNNHNRTFTDVTSAVGLPGDFDEGIKFIDWNNDGKLDLIIHHPISGPALWEFDGTRFTKRDVMPQYFNWNMNGLNVADLNGDGREDVIFASGALLGPVVLLNTGDAFERDPLTLIDTVTFNPVAAYDYDGDGAIDLVLASPPWPSLIARNITQGINRQTLTIEVVDAAGRRNQFGRVVHIRPDSTSGTTMTRVVDGGSGLLSQTPYPITVPTPYTGPHHVDVRFAGRTVTFSMQPGARIRVFANGTTQPF
jgi:hypothetical protein